VEVYVKLTADAVSFYTCDGEKENEDLPPEDLSPEASVLLSRVASLLGQKEGSDHLRLVDVLGNWWELRSDVPGEVESWVSVIAARIEHFRKASARMNDTEEAHEAAIQSFAASRSLNDSDARRPMAKLARRFLPCLDREVKQEEELSRQLSPYRGDRLGHGSLVDDDEFSKHIEPDLQEVQGAHWSEDSVLYLRQCQHIPDDLKYDFRLTLRWGVPDGLKHLIWPLAAGSALPRVAEIQDYYNHILARSFGDIVPREFEDPVPTFCQGMKDANEEQPLRDAVKHLPLLNSEGEAALRRLLWCVALTNDRFDSCPFLPHLFAALLLFVSEPEAMFIFQHIIDVDEHREAESLGNPAIICNRRLINKQARLFVIEAQKNKLVPDVLAHLERLHLDLHDVAVHLLQDGLARALNFRAFCRVVGSSLAEGSEIILRYGLALLRLKGTTLLECSTPEDARARVECLGHGLEDSPEAIDALTKAAFSLRMHTRDGINRMSSVWGCEYVAPVVKNHIFCRPRLHEPRGSCPDKIWEMLWPEVPEMTRILDPRLVHTKSTHGTLLRTLFARCDEYEDAPMIFFVFTQAGDIIGGYSPHLWVRNKDYMDVMSLMRPVADAFVFRKLRTGDKLEVFPWTGDNGMLLQAHERSGLNFGGDGVAISIDKEFSRGSTSASKTFDSPALVPSADGEVSDQKTEHPVEIDFIVSKFETFALA